MSQLENISPATSKLAGLETSGRVAGVILTAKSQEFHFISRYFAPWNGIPEDPVTGSAHTVLAPYWSGQLALKTMLAKQCSPRGGVLEVSLGSGGRMEVAGESVVVLEGDMMM
jgi:predicted PhzF superfamily epimerase YddE/YHI9